MKRIKLKFTNDTPDTDKPLTWGIHKELSDYLMVDGRLITMFTDTSTTESILQICLSDRGDLGEIITPFLNSDSLDVESMLQFLEELHNYFEDFFFQNQQRVSKMEKKFQELQTTKQ